MVYQLSKFHHLTFTVYTVIETADLVATLQFGACDLQLMLVHSWHQPELLVIQVSADWLDCIISKPLELLEAI